MIMAVIMVVIMAVIWEEIWVEGFKYTYVKYETTAIRFFC